MRSPAHCHVRPPVQRIAVGIPVLSDRELTRHRAVCQIFLQIGVADALHVVQAVALHAQRFRQPVSGSFQPFRHVGVRVAQVTSKAPVLSRHVGALAVIVGMEIKVTLLEAPSPVVAIGILVAEVPVPIVAVAVVQHHVHVYIQPVGTHHRYCPQQFIAGTPSGSNRALLVLAADIVVIKGVVAVGVAAGCPFEHRRYPHRRKSGPSQTVGLFRQVRPPGVPSTRAGVPVKPLHEHACRSLQKQREHEDSSEYPATCAQLHHPVYRSERNTYSRIILLLPSAPVNVRLTNHP
ncbi:hypothetical protein HRbin16_01833 [bacterium HR16]|nr:hypothetical protein HRbin16_01833 [bacterium HR16]